MTNYFLQGKKILASTLIMGMMLPNATGAVANSQSPKVTVISEKNSQLPFLAGINTTSWTEYNAINDDGFFGLMTSRYYATPDTIRIKKLANKNTPEVQVNLTNNDLAVSIRQSFDMTTFKEKMENIRPRWATKWDKRLYRFATEPNIASESENISAMETANNANNAVLKIPDSHALAGGYIKTLGSEPAPNEPFYLLENYNTYYDASQDPRSLEDNKIFVLPSGNYPAGEYIFSYGVVSARSQTGQASTLKIIIEEVNDASEVGFSVESPYYFVDENFKKEYKKLQNSGEANSVTRKKYNNRIVTFTGSGSEFLPINSSFTDPVDEFENGAIINNINNESIIIEKDFFEAMPEVRVNVAENDTETRIENYDNSTHNGIKNYQANSARETEISLSENKKYKNLYALENGELTIRGGITGVPNADFLVKYTPLSVENNQETALSPAYANVKIINRNVPNFDASAKNDELTAFVGGGHTRNTASFALLENDILEYLNPKTGKKDPVFTPLEPSLYNIEFFDVEELKKFTSDTIENGSADTNGNFTINIRDMEPGRKTLGKYRLCEKANPTKCSEKAEIIINAQTLSAPDAEDDSTTKNREDADPTVTLNLTANDSYTDDTYMSTILASADSGKKYLSDDDIEKYFTVTYLWNNPSVSVQKNIATIDTTTLLAGENDLGKYQICVKADKAVEPNNSTENTSESENTISAEDMKRYCATANISVNIIEPMPAAPLPEPEPAPAPTPESTPTPEPVKPEEPKIPETPAPAPVKPEEPKVPETPTPEPVKPEEPKIPETPAPAPLPEPKTPNGDGPGGYIPNIPVAPFKPITIDGNIPVFSAPMLNYQCVSPVKNLDDPKLLAYYDDLQIINRENIHRELTRAEFVKLIINAAKLTPEKANLDILANFTDVKKSEWFAPYVAYAVEYGLITGQTLPNNASARTFRPHDTISRAEASKVLSALLLNSTTDLPTPEKITTFSDIASNDSLSPYIQYAYNSCLLHGRNTIDGNPLAGKPRVFEPISGITLAETAKILYNMTRTSEEKMQIIQNK